MKDKMTATLPEKSDCKAINYGDKKEIVDSRTFVVMKDGKLETPLTVRFYMGRSTSASRVYCSFWLQKGMVFHAGSGWADGHGYHKSSAAFQEALDSAGIELSKPIDAAGDQAIDEAMEAIVRALGYRGAGLVVAQ